MKISFMTFACPEWSIDQVIAAAERHRYHGIEFRCDANHAHGVEIAALKSERDAIRKKLEKAGIEPCCLATSLQFVRDDVTDLADARIQLAADLGIPGVRVFCGKPDESLEPTLVHQTVAANLRLVADQCEAFGIELWLETHDHYCRAADAAQAVQLANHRAVAFNYDNMHPYRMGEDLATTFQALGDKIRHTHFHDSVNAPDKVMITRVGEGGLPIDDMFQALVDIDYQGYLSGEWFNDQYGPTPEASLEAYREDMTDLAARHGVKL